MSSHREAPEILKDPVADNTDVYAFVSPDKPDTVTLIANWIPFENPAGGPYFYLFGDDVLYEIHISNSGSPHADITYQFRFTTQFQNPNTFLYNTGPIKSLDDPNWNVRQFYSVTRWTRDGSTTTLADQLACPPCNVGPRSTPNYANLASMAIHRLSNGGTVFAGQREEGFNVDIGAVFDLGDLRPLQNLHLIPTPAQPGVDGTRGFNVHSIAIQLPMSEVSQSGNRPSDPMSPSSVIGVWASASRAQVRVRNGDEDGRHIDTGPYVQVSRLANPLFNEVLVPTGLKDVYNATKPATDAQFLPYVLRPELAKLLPVLYPGGFPHLASLNNDPAAAAERKDLAAVFLTGIPAGIVPGFQNATGSTPAEMMRLNLAIPPSASPNPLGLIGGDAAGFPNGRRVTDNVTVIELRAVAGATFPLIDKNFTPDAAVSQVTDGTTPDQVINPFLSSFPYLGTPLGGFEEVPPDSGTTPSTRA